MHVAWGEVLGVTQSALATRDDGDFEQGVGVSEEPATDGVTGFVVGDCAFFVGVEDERAFFEAADYALDGLFEVGECYALSIKAGGYGLLV